MRSLVYKLRISIAGEDRRRFEHFAIAGAKYFF